MRQALARLFRRRNIAAATGVCLCGAAGGVGSFTFIYADGASYMTNRPEACANCHVMSDHLSAWMKSGHHHVATCNDCHAPHDFLGKYMTKARNGFNHSLAFTIGRFHEPIRITPRNMEIAEAACRHCHQDMVEAVDHGGGSADRLNCTHCHAGVGHAR